MSNNLYWSERLADNIYKKNVALTQKELRKIYKQATKEIQAQLVNVYADMLKDGEVSANTLYREQRYTSLINSISREVQALGKAEDTHMQLSLFNTLKQAYIGTSEGLGVTIDWALINPNMVKEIVFSNIGNANFSDRIWSNKDKLNKLLQKSLVDTVVAGNDKDKAVSMLMERMGVGFSDADRLVRTETMRVINGGQMQTYQDRGYTRYTISTYLDSRTSDICKDIDTSNEYEFTNAVVGVNMPPLHVNCRSTIIPVISSRAE